MKRGLTTPSVVVACFCALAVCAAAQVPTEPRPAPAPGAPTGSKSGNPTPGTPQPEPPNLADRVTLTGCLQVRPNGSASARPTDPNEPSDAKFMLVRAERKHVVPPDTGTSPAAAQPLSATYRLKAIESQLSPLVGAAVEISGEVLPSTLKQESGSPGPTLVVEFVQKLSQKCS